MTHQTSHSYSSPADWFKAGLEYSLDRWQRCVLFGDVMRQRGNNYLAHLRAGQPPVLAFEYEPVLAGMDFDPPVNYSLLRIRDRRTGDDDRRVTARTTARRRKGLTEGQRSQGVGPHQSQGF